MPPRGQAKTTTAAIKWPAGVPADYIDNEKYIDFSVAPWPFVLQSLAEYANTAARTAVLKSGSPNEVVLVEYDNFIEWCPTWQTLIKDTRRGNALVLASRGEQPDDGPCTNRCSTGNKKFFKHCLAVQGHFNNACSNCVSVDQKTKCSHYGVGGGADAGPGMCATVWLDKMTDLYSS